VNKRLVQEKQMRQEQESTRLPDEGTTVYISKLERCIAALSLKFNIPNPFLAQPDAGAIRHDQLENTRQQYETSAFT
jgi:hypothetical protein